MKNCNEEISDYLFESLINRDDIPAVHYWRKKTVFFSFSIFSFDIIFSQSIETTISNFTKLGKFTVLSELRNKRNRFL